MRALLAVGLLVTGLGTAHAQTVQRIDITEFGTYAAHVDKKIEAAGTATGTTNVISDVKLVQAGSVVPRRIGTRFGLRYTIVGDGGGDVTLTKIVRVPSPGLRNPATGNAIVTEKVPLQRRIGVNYYTGYSFEQDWELVPGTWTIELWQGERKLASRSFTIAKP